MHKKSDPSMPAVRIRLWFGAWALGIASLASAQTAIPPSVSQIAFAPATIQSGASSRLTISFGNANASAATLLQTLTDTLPAGMIVANPSGLGGNCPGATAVAGGRAIAYPANAVIPAGGCSLQVNVTGTSKVRNTYYTDSIGAGALVTNLGTNLSATSGSVTVQGIPTVPNVIGLSQAAAASALQAAGFTLGAVSKGPGTANIPYNAVFSQTPAAGAAATPGSAVSINISTGAGLATNPNRPLTSVQNFVAPYQLSEAAAIERLCAAVQSSDPVSLTAAQRNLGANCNAIIGTYGGGVDPAGLKNTLDALSGKQSTAQQRTGVQFAGAQFTNIGARLAQLRQGASGASLSNLDLGLPAGGALTPLFAALENALGRDDDSRSDVQPERGGGASADPDSISALTRLGFFINGSLRRGTQDTTTYETPFDFRSTSVTAGTDYRLTNYLILGLAVGHSSGSTIFSDGSGRLDSKSNSGSLYATYYHEALYVDMMGTFAHISYNAARNTAFSINPNTQGVPSNCSASDCSVDTTGSTGAKQVAFDTNVGYSFNHGAFTYGPDIALNYTRVKVNAFAESDPYGSGLSLTFGEDTGESLVAKAGGHVSYAIKLPFGVVLPEARAHYVHEFKNDQRALSVHFSSDPFADTPTGPVSNFVVFTDPPDRGYFDWAAGLSAQFAFGISAFVDYNATSSSNQRVHEFALGLRLEHQVP
jgi:outer membrane lipase/esterase